MLIKAFRDIVKKCKDRIAIKTGEESFTYDQLDKNSDKISIQIISEISDSTGKEPVAALLFEHGADMIAGSLGALKAYTIYVPFDPTYPEGRLEYMLKDSGASLIVTNDANMALAGRLAAKSDKEVKLLNINNNNELELKEIKAPEEQSDKIAYLLYTSGSTGTPKGIIQTHRNILYFANSYIKTLGLTEADKMTLFSAFSHDASIVDIYSGILSGACLYPYNMKEQANIGRLSKWLCNEEITVWHSVPTLYRYFLNTLSGTEQFPQIRYVVLGGENVLSHDVTKHFSLLKNTALVNLYGQSESSFNSAQIIRPEDKFTGVNIGKAIDGTQLVILNEKGKKMSFMRPGELVIVSNYLALGYWKDEERTSTAFCEHPELGRIYKTGDMGFVNPNGNVEYLGRKDFQIKIRGYRVELEEVENSLMKYGELKEAAVIGKTDENGDMALYAYIVSDEQINTEKLRLKLAEYLPEYMIPTSLIQLPKLPLTPTNKVDRLALQKVSIKAERSTEYHPPENEAEERLVRIFEEILKVEQVGTSDSFYELGGHSLKAASLIARLHKELNVEIPMKELFKNPTVKDLSEYIKGMKESKYTAIEVAEEREYYELSSAQKRLYTLHQFETDGISYNMPNIIAIEGKLDKIRLEEAFCKLIQRHEALRTSFHMENEEIVQKIHSKLPFEIEYKEAKEEQIADIVKSFVRAFDLRKAPLLRVGLIKINEERHILMYDIHHIISDGVSMTILLQEFISFYEGKELPKLRLQYKDYAVWQNRKESLETLEKQGQYWTEILKDCDQPLAMPLDYQREAIQTFAGDTISFNIDSRIVQKLNTLAQKEKTTVNTVLISAYNILLSKYCNQKDITVGVTVANRPNLELENVIGAFINFLPIRSRVNEDMSFLDFMRQQKNIISEAYNHQEYPFDEMVKNISVRIDNNRNPIFDTMLIYHNELNYNTAINIEGLSFSKVEFNKQTSKLDFKFDVFPSKNGSLDFYLEYNTGLYKKESMKRFGEHYGLLLEKCIDNAGLNMSDIDIFTETEKISIKEKREAINKDISITKLAVAATFTAEPIEEYIKWWCEKHKHNVELSFAQYNQVFQELLDENSIISRNNGINLLMVRFEDWIRDINANDEYKLELLEANYNRLTELLRNKNKSCLYIVGIFPVSDQLGLSNQIIEYINNMNQKWQSEVKNLEGVEVLDFSAMADQYGIKEIFDPVKDKVGHMPFSDEYYAAIAAAIARHICAVKASPFKVIAVDCDNTLWNGICGEDGVMGVKVTEPYMELQKLLIKKHDEGMLVVLCSKNNEGDVWEVFEKNTQMLLKKEHLVGWKLNWRPKSDNLKELAEELNLGIDSFIFIDDNPMECYDMMKNNPKVLTLQLPEEPQQIPMYLKHVWAFDKLKVTAEDRARTKSYQQERERKELQKSSFTLEDFLKEIKPKVYINEIDKEQIPRVSQLTQRTNQFNLSTKRRSEEDIEMLMHNPKVKCWTVEVEDRFGEYGLTGVLIIENQDNKLLIDTFLLSCRVLGRGIENAIMTALKKHCQQNEIHTVQADFYPTAKNHAIKSFIEKAGWSKTDETTEYIRYILSTQELPDSIKHIECIYEKPNKTSNKSIESNKLECSLDHIGIAVNSLDAMEEYYKAMSFINTAATFDPLQNASLVMLKKEGLDSIELVYMSDIERRTYIPDGNKAGKPYHLCYRVKDFSEVLKELDNNNIPWEIVSQAKQAVLFGGKEVMFIHVQGAGVIEFLQENTLDNGFKVENVIRLKTTDYENCITFFKVLGYFETNRIYNEARKVMSIVLSKQGTGNIELLADMGSELGENSELSQQRAGVQQICYKCDSSEISNYLNNTISKDVISSYKYGSLSKANIILQSDEAQYNLFYSVPGTVKSTTEMNWQITIENEAELLHSAYLLSLKYYTGEKLLQMPIYENMKAGRKSNNYEAPRNPLEEKLVKIFEEILRVEKVGINNSFFDLGGHSLRATSLIGRLHKELNIEVPLREIFRTPTIKGLVEYIKLSGENVYEEIEKAEEKEYYEMSSAQKRLYTLQQLDMQSTGYNISGVLEITGVLDVQRLEEAFIALVNRHEALRTSFELNGEEILQKIHDRVDFEIEYNEVKDSEVSALVKEFVRPFDLEKAPLLRVGLVKIHTEKHILLYDMHHIISDGVSMSILVEEFIKLYQHQELPELKIQYKDYAAWQNKLKSSEIMKKQEEYWLKEFEGELPVLSLPTDYPRPPIQSFAGDSINFELNEKLTAGIRQLSKQTGATTYMVLLSGFSILLAKYSGQEDIVVGSPIAGRQHNDLTNIMGVFVNTLAMRSYPEGNKLYKDYLEEVKNRCLRTYENQAYQFEELVEKLNVRRDMSRNPLFDVVLVLQNTEMKTVDIEDLSFSVYQGENKISKFDITLNVHERKDHIDLKVEYSTKLFTEETIIRLTKHLTNVFTSVINNSGIKIDEIDILNEEEKQQLLFDFNSTMAEYPKNKTIHQIFEEQAAATPENIAAVYGEYQLTYRELNERANQLARVLRENGVAPDSLVGIMVERSMDMVIGILGILKAGGAYLPIDPEYPRERKEYMLQDSGSKLLITQSSLENRVYFDGKLVLLDEETSYAEKRDNLEHVNKPCDIAYVIYTSGTTGKPKGALIEHGNVVRLFFNDKMQFDFKPRDVWTMFHSYCFDFSVWEMYGALLYGGKLVIVPKTIAQDPSEYLKLLNKEQVTVLNQTPTAFYNLSAEEEKSKEKQLAIRYIIFGGEALKPAHLKSWKQKYENTKLINMYGITETTVHVTYKEITEYEIANNIGNIGRPIPTLTTYIMDKNMRLLPIGVAGELCVGGAGVCRGYLNKPELTATRFVQNPYIPGERLYRSGDLVKVLPDGDMEYLGRIDHQVKIRGHRIELGEIENRLLNHKSITEALVLAKLDSDGNNYICAYIVEDRMESVENKLTLSELRGFLSEELPDYMLPAYFVELDRMPLTSNGKIDRRALPEPDCTMSTGTEYQPPENEEQEQLASIWGEVLKVDRAGINDNFFTLGGDSIKALRLVSAINKRMGKQLHIRSVFQFPTIKELSECLSEIQEDKTQKEMENARSEVEATKRAILESPEQAAKLRGNVEDIYQMSEIAQGMIYHYLKNPKEAVYHDQMLYPVEDKNMNFEALQKAIEIMTQKHAILRTSFNIYDFYCPVQIVYTDFNPEVQYIDLKAMTKEEQINSIKKHMEEDRKKIFDLSKPLWRVNIFLTSETSYMFALICHHAVLDGWSVASFITELSSIYTSIKEAGENEFYPGEMKYSYKDYVIEQIAIKNNKEISDYWKEELIGYKRLSLKKDTEYGSFKAVKYNLGKELLVELKKTAARYKTNIKTVCFTAYAYMMNMLSYENDIVLGLVEHSRPTCEESDKLLGCFLNTVPFRMKFIKGMKWEDLLRSVDKKIIELKLYGKLPLSEILKELGESTVRENSLFDTLFNYIDFHIMREISMQTSNSNAGKSGNLSYARTNTLFNFAITNTFEAFELDIRYDDSIYIAGQMDTVVQYYKNILNIFIKSPETEINKNEVLPLEERQRVIFDLNHTKMDYSNDKTTSQLFEEQAAKTPEKMAVVYQNNGLTYRQLNEKSDLLAELLRNKGVKEDSIVAIIAERSLEMIVGIMGILKAGGAYLPIDPSYPKDRIGFMLDDGKVNILLTQSHIVDRTEFDGEIICIDDSRIYEAKASVQRYNNTVNNLAYVIYTSGSTGKPKGTAIEHSSLTNLVMALKERIYDKYTEPLNIALVAPYVFDASVKQIFPSLLLGHTLFIVPDETRFDGSKLLDYYQEKHIDISDATPTHIRIMLDALKKEDKCIEMKELVVGGEALGIKLVKEILNINSRLVVTNVYGPTECCDVTTTYSIDSRIVNSINVIPIGSPIGNTKIYILDKNLELLPEGMAGELCIAGKGLSRGYLNRADLTAEKFVENPFQPGYRMYRTGDMARWLPDRNIEFLGRIDQQIKIRGFRVELGEIESCLLLHQAIKEATVIAGENQEGIQQLCAYIAADREMSVNELKEYLGGVLPDYMIPSYFIQMDKLPLTNNGKLDKKALPKPDTSTILRAEYEAPGTEVEKRIANIWKELLNINEISIHDNFFDIGGNSLKIIQLNNRISNEFKVQLSITDFFKYTNIKSLAEYLVLPMEEVAITTEIHDNQKDLDEGKKRLQRRMQRNKGEM